MLLTEQISNIFPAEQDIPAEFCVETPIRQAAYLIDGELRHWEGPMQEVCSPVWVRTVSGLKQKVLGHYPLLTETEAVAALEAATRAYDNGRGRWPTLAVEARINQTRAHEFTYRMQEQKAEVVNINSQCQRGSDTFPFTGRKDSAEGTLSVSDALRVFSIRTLVAAKASDTNKAILTTIVRERASNFLSTDFLL